jgi:hypothetical protein
MGQATVSLEGGLRLRVAVREGVVVAVDLDSTRPVTMSATLVGRDIDAAMALLPRLFSLCGVAQAVAGLTAIEAALGVAPAPPQIAARQLLVAAEALEQTAWRLLLDWPRGVGAAPLLTTLKRLRQLVSALRPTLFPDPAWNRVGGSPLAPDLTELGVLLDGVECCLYQSVYGLAPGERWPPEERRDFERWLRAVSTPATLTLRHVRERGLADFGRSAVAPLPLFDASAMERRLAADDGHAFCARPDFGGVVYETGALARLWRHPLIADLRAEHGNGLLTRLAARMIESGNLLAEMRARVASLAAHPGIAVVETASGAGLGVVECARGRLVHRVAVAGDRVADYKILAPTEWNFHPNGPLARGLAGARAGREMAAIRQTIEWLVTALDPCVGCDLVVEKR